MSSVPASSAEALAEASVEVAACGNSRTPRLPTIQEPPPPLISPETKAAMASNPPAENPAPTSMFKIDPSGGGDGRGPVGHGNGRGPGGDVDDRGGGKGRGPRQRARSVTLSESGSCHSRPPRRDLKQWISGLLSRSYQDDLGRAATNASSEYPAGNGKDGDNNPEVAAEFPAGNEKDDANNREVAPVEDDSSVFAFSGTGSFGECGPGAAGLSSEEAVKEGESKEGVSNEGASNDGVACNDGVASNDGVMCNEGVCNNCIEEGGVVRCEARSSSFFASDVSSADEAFADDVIDDVIDATSSSELLVRQGSTTSSSNCTDEYHLEESMDEPLEMAMWYDEEPVTVKRKLPPSSTDKPVEQLLLHRNEEAPVLSLPSGSHSRSDQNGLTGANAVPEIASDVRGNGEQIDGGYRRVRGLSQHQQGTTAATTNQRRLSTNDARPRRAVTANSPTRAGFEDQARHARELSRMRTRGIPVRIGQRWQQQWRLHPYDPLATKNRFWRPMPPQRSRLRWERLERLAGSCRRALPPQAQGFWPFVFGSPAYPYLESFFRIELDFLAWDKEREWIVNNPTAINQPRFQGRFDKDCVLLDDDGELEEIAAGGLTGFQGDHPAQQLLALEGVTGRPSSNNRDIVLGCHLPKLAGMCVHPDLPMAMATGENVVRELSNPFNTLDYFMESCIKFERLFGQLSLKVIAQVEDINRIARWESRVQSLERQTLTLKVSVRTVRQGQDCFLKCPRQDHISDLCCRQFRRKERSVFRRRLNDWVEHLARQYVLLGREVEAFIADRGIARDTLSPALPSRCPQFIEDPEFCGHFVPKVDLKGQRLDHKWSVLQTAVRWLTNWTDFFSSVFSLIMVILLLPWRLLMPIPERWLTEEEKGRFIPAASGHGGDNGGTVIGLFNRYPTRRCRLRCGGFVGDEATDARLRMLPFRHWHLITDKREGEFARKLARNSNVRNMTELQIWKRMQVEVYDIRNPNSFLRNLFHQKYGRTTYTIRCSNLGAPNSS